MSDHALPYLGELRETVVDWKKLRKTGLNIALFALLGGGVYYVVAGSGRLMLRAEGYIARERVSVAPSFDGRVTDVFVQPGDHVENGQLLAAVKSVSIGRTMSELTAERARLLSRIAQLKARQRVLQETTPLAEQNADKASAYLKDLNNAGARGFALSRSMQEMTSAALTATEHFASVKAEKTALDSELAAHESALGQTNDALASLDTAYGNGLLYANTNGEIGASVARVGEVISTSTGSGVAEILTGERYALAIVPDSYLFDVTVGQPVRVSAGKLTLTGHVDRLLPFAAAPAQLAHRQDQSPPHGRMVRIALPSASGLAVDQQIRVSSCLFGCDGLLFADQLRDVVARLAGGVREVSLSAATSVLQTVLTKPAHETASTATTKQVR